MKSKENNGRLDFLVNNCYAAVTLLLGKENKTRVDKFWEQDPLIWDTVSTDFRDPRTAYINRPK